MQMEGQQESAGVTWLAVEVGHLEVKLEIHAQPLKMRTHKANCMLLSPRE